MSNQKHRKTESKKILTVQAQNVNRYFDEMGKTASEYFQSIANLQRAYAAAWSNAAESVISIQREFARRAGISTGLPEAITKIANDPTEEIINAQAVQSKMVLAAIDATIQNISTFNENARTFMGPSQNLMQSWISAFNPTRN
jgi:hypothetical protein